MLFGGQLVIVHKCNIFRNDPVPNFSIYPTHKITIFISPRQFKGQWGMEKQFLLIEMWDYKK